MIPVEQSQQDHSESIRARQAADRAAAKLARQLDGETAAAPSHEPPAGKTSDFVVAPPNAKDMTPKPKRLSKAQRDSAALAKAVEAVTPAKPKRGRLNAAVAAKRAAAKAKVERVPAAHVEALLKELGITKSELARAAGVSPSLVAEWVGHGRGHLMNRDRWPAVEKAARAFAKGR